MELMRLNESEIAKDRWYRFLDDVLKDTPFQKTWTWSGGRNEDSLIVWAVFSDGKQLRLDGNIHAGDACNHVADVETSSATIGEQIAEWDIDALIFQRIESDQNGNNEWEEYLPITSPDWGKVRRRVEDALRKTADKAVLFHFADKLSVKIY